MIAPLLAFGIGIVAGSRAVLAPTVVSWAIARGWLSPREPRLQFLAHPIAPKILTGLAIGELVGDKLPTTPSRAQPAPFSARVLSGALSGAAIGSAGGSLLSGLLAGAVGGAVGTLGLRAARRLLADAFGNDWPAALLEDAAAIASGLLIARRTRSLRSVSTWERVPRLLTRGTRFRGRPAPALFPV
jgi:uncharacterized membrane protein